MKYWISGVALLWLMGSAHVICAQAPDTWVQVSSAADHFHFSMPHQPKEETLSGLRTNFGDLDIKVKSYEDSANGASYRLWVLTLPGKATSSPMDIDTYIDSSAEVIWEGLLKPERDKLPDDRRATA